MGLEKEYTLKALQCPKYKACYLDKKDHTATRWLYMMLYKYYIYAQDGQVQLVMPQVKANPLARLSMQLLRGSLFMVYVPVVPAVSNQSLLTRVCFVLQPSFEVAASLQIYSHSSLGFLVFEPSYLVQVSEAAFWHPNGEIAKIVKWARGAQNIVFVASRQWVGLVF